jgi:hypothetical protein
MKSTSHSRLSGILGVTVAMALVTAGGLHAASPAAKAKPKVSKPPVSGVPCPTSPKCEGNRCSNVPYVKTDCWSTPYGPPEADVVVGNNPVTSTNMLYCNGGTYALCFFSGPPYKTGSNPEKNNALSCVRHGDVALCNCQAYTTGAYYVDINAILNRGVYLNTVSTCGPDGSLCQNIKVCGSNPSATPCTNLKVPPVCEYVKNQSLDNPAGSLMPKANLDSTFSFAMTDYKLNASPPDCKGAYAGCMTAPCFYQKGHTTTYDGEVVRCECPIYTGTFQVGEAGQSCTIKSDGGNYVWSAARTVSSSTTSGGGN